MDYKEIKKKRTGETLIFCNFNDLLQELTGFSDKDEAIANSQTSGNEIITYCPFCKSEGYQKKKLYIKKDFTVGHCFHCTRSFIHVDNEVKVDYQVPGFLGGFLGWNGDITLPKLTDIRWNLDNWMYDFDTTDEVGEKYLASRHGFLPEIAKLLDFKYNNGNIVIPFRYRGNVVYYQIRFSGKSKIKYFFPPVENGMKMPYILDFGEGKRRLIVCEGVFDAIALMIMAPDYLPIAVLGSSISDYQLGYLREYIPEEIVVYMDETRISQKIVNKIKSQIDYCPIRIIPSGGEDPEENLISRIKRGKNLQWIRPQENKVGFKNNLTNIINNYTI